MFPSIPGSRRDPINEPDDPTTAGLSSGRFTEAQLIMMTELIEWWAYRRTQNDADSPINSLIGGIDLKGTATTIGLTPATVTLNQTLSPKTNSTGSSYIVHAYGIPNPANVGEVYSIVALCHFYYISDAFLSRYTQIARSPSSDTSTEIRAAVNVSGDPILSVVGIASITIDWHLDISQLQL